MEDKQLKQKEAVSQHDPALIKTVTAAVLQTLQATGSIPGERQNQGNQQQEVKTVDLVGLFFQILERFWVVLLCALLGAALMGWMAGNTTTIYSATSKLYIVNPDGGGINIANLQLGTVLTLDYQEVFKTWEVHEMVIEELNLNHTYEEMQSMLTVSNPEDTRILYITATYPDAQMAADIANAYAVAGKRFITEAMLTDEPTTFSVALVPSVSASSSTTSQIIKGFLLGTVLAGGLLVLAFVLDTRPKSPEDIMSCSGLPTLAVIPVGMEVTSKRKHKSKKAKKHRKVEEDE